jgi:hypothetical protein
MLSMHPVTVVSRCHIFAMQHAAVLRWKHCCPVVNAPCHGCQPLSHLCKAAYCSLTMEALLHTAVLRWIATYCILQSYDGSTVAMLSSFTIEALLPCCPCTLSQLLAVVTSLQCSILQSYVGSTVAMLSSLTIEALLPCCPCTCYELHGFSLLPGVTACHCYELTRLVTVTSCHGFATVITATS